jgi:hypothetical protein
MANRNTDLAKIMVLVTLAVCVAAVVDPRFRKLCFGLLCRL